MIDEDIKQINEKGVAMYLTHMEQTHLGAGFWDFRLVSDLETSGSNNNAYNVYLAALCNCNAHAFLARSMKISSLIQQRGDIHHIFPKKYLIKHNFPQKLYNQVANYVYTEQATNIKIGMMAPTDYMNKVTDQIQQGLLDVSTLHSESELIDNLFQNDIPITILESTHSDYEDFLAERRKLMAQKIKTYYEQL